MGESPPITTSLQPRDDEFEYEGDCCVFRQCPQCGGPESLFTGLMMTSEKTEWHTHCSECDFRQTDPLVTDVPQPSPDARKYLLSRGLGKQHKDGSWWGIGLDMQYSSRLHFDTERPAEATYCEECSEWQEDERYWFGYRLNVTCGSGMGECRLGHDHHASEHWIM